MFSSLKEKIASKTNKIISEVASSANSSSNLVSEKINLVKDNALSIPSNLKGFDGVKRDFEVLSNPNSSPLEKAKSFAVIAMYFNENKLSIAFDNIQYTMSSDKKKLEKTQELSKYLNSDIRYLNIEVIFNDFLEYFEKEKVEKLLEKYNLNTNSEFSFSIFKEVISISKINPIELIFELVNPAPP